MMGGLLGFPETFHRVCEVLPFLTMYLYKVRFLHVFQPTAYPNRLNIKVDIRVVLSSFKPDRHLMVFAKVWNIVTFVTKFLFCCGNIIFFIKKIGYLVSGEAVSHGTLSIPALHRDMTQTEEDESFSRTSMMQEERKVIPSPWIH